MKISLVTVIPYIAVYVNFSHKIHILLAVWVKFGIEDLILMLFSIVSFTKISEVKAILCLGA
jgi:hypothetical protein